MNVEYHIVLPEEVRTKAEVRAQALGMSVTEYVQSLVTQDVASLADPWRQPLPWEVEKQYLLDEIEFYESELNVHQKGATSAEELVELLNN
jgi:antitoxin component of RelBE/YafQ-DinJ toxin-antitoxin module